jgi:hypothetical protein
MGKNGKHQLANNDVRELTASQPISQPKTPIPGLTLVNQAPLEDSERLVGQDLLDTLEEKATLVDGAPPQDAEVNADANKSGNGKRRSRRRRGVQTGNADSRPVGARSPPATQHKLEEQGGVNAAPPYRPPQAATNPQQAQAWSNFPTSNGQYYGQQQPAWGQQAVWGMQNAALPYMQQSSWRPVQSLPYRNAQSNPWTQPNSFTQQQQFMMQQQNWRNPPAAAQQTGWGSSAPQSFGLPINATSTAQFQANNFGAKAIGRMQGTPGKKPWKNEQGYLMWGLPPLPTAAYTQQATTKPNPELRDAPGKLLVILDLNGVLLYRERRKDPKKFDPRSDLAKFFEYLFANHEVMIWSSAKPENVESMVQNLFNEEQYSKLVAIWARDKLRLTPTQYAGRAQVYKQLSWVWEDTDIEAKGLETGQGNWSQSNTVLVDDSALKASAEPHNLVEVPEFKGVAKEYSCGSVLSQIAGYLEDAKYATDVSYHMRNAPFKVDGGWKYEW